MGKRSLSLAAILAAGVAMADAPVKPNGIKIGDGRLHPSVSLRVGYDSAAGYFGSTPGTATLGGDLLVSPLLGLLFNLDTAPVTFNLNGNAGYNWYTGIINSSSRDLSHVTAGVNLDGAVNRTGPVEFQFGDAFSRSNHSTNVAAGIGLLALYNSVYVAAPIHPGGGALSVTPRVRWDVEFFTPLLPSRLATCMAGDLTCDPTVASKMNYSNLNFDLSARWKFLPKTAAVVDVSFDYRLYFNSQRTVAAGTAPTVDTTTNLPGELLRVTGGLSGLITNHISTLLLVGGGGDWGGSGARTFIAQAELAWLGNDFTARGGYLRTLNPVPIFGTYGQDRAYLELKTTLIGRLTMRGMGTFDLITYYSGAGRNDYLVTATAEIGYQFVSFFSAALTYNLTYRNALFTTPGFVRHEPALVLTLSY